MEEKKSVFDYIGQVFQMFGFCMLWMLCFVKIFGESAKEISTFFSLGTAGIPVNIVLQFFGISIVLVFFRYFFFTEVVLKNLSLAKRTIGMVLTILTIISSAIYLFSWFPVDMWEAWLMFLLSFFLCFLISVKIVTVKAKIENKKLADGLAKIQKEWEESDEK